jgi:hypothetical protein
MRSRAAHCVRENCSPDPTAQGAEDTWPDSYHRDSKEVPTHSSEHREVYSSGAKVGSVKARKKGRASVTHASINRVAGRVYPSVEMERRCTTLEFISLNTKAAIKATGSRTNAPLCA